ncbi:hypothetical protein IFR05_003809 [Cadophora sp. M221]|nr:hypothetical protein IFR05_003809 [Cadophora sp. M221]
MGRMTMCASSEDEIERPECFILRLSASPATVTNFKFDPWPTRSMNADSTPSSIFTTRDNSWPQVTAKQSHKSKSTTKSPTSSFRISKRRHRSRNCRPSMRVNHKNEKILKEIRSTDLQERLKRSPWEWLQQRTDEKQPNEVAMKLRRLQFEAMKRTMKDRKLKDWEISALCLEGGSRLRKVVKEEEVE